MLTWSKNCSCTAENRKCTIKINKFIITDTKLYVPVVISSIQDNKKAIETIIIRF